MQVELINFAGGTVKGSALWDQPDRLVRGHGRYHDAEVRGNVFTCSDTAGRTVPAGLSTAPTTVTLFNPLGSGVFCSLLYAGLNFSVNTPPTIGVAWVGVTPPSVTAVTCTYNGTISPPISSSRGAVSGSRVVPMGGGGVITLPSTPVIIGELGVSATGAMTLLPIFPALFKFFDGVVGVGPGGSLSIQCSQASSAAACWATWMWEEIPQYGSGTVLAA